MSHHSCAVDCQSAVSAECPGCILTAFAGVRTGIANGGREQGVIIADNADVFPLSLGADEDHVCQCGAVYEGSVADAGNGIGDVDCEHLRAVGKGVEADGGHTSVHRDSSNLVAILIPGDGGLVVVRHRTCSGDGQRTVSGESPGEVFAVLVTSAEAGDGYLQRQRRNF